MHVMRHQTRELDINVRTNTRCNDCFGRIKPASRMSENQGQLRVSTGRSNVERWKCKGSAGSGVNDNRQFVSQSGFEEEIRPPRDRVQPVILRLQLQGAESEFFGAAL